MESQGLKASNSDITQLLSEWANGNRDALDSLAPLVQAELRRIADAYLRREHAGHTLQPTALVNEAWLRLVKQEQPEFESRRRFYALAAQVMRQILIDYARGARAGKRGGGEFAVALPHSLSGGDTGVEDFLALNEALEQLAKFSPRQAQVIELRYFGGLDVEESAGLLEVSPATISREQRSAEAWLGRTMSARATESRS
jgi:RNA polymerase sigma factor (TIGR02999 family)